MEERVHFLSMLWGTMSSFANVKMMKLYATYCCFPNSLLYLISQNLDHLGISSTFPFVHSVTMPYDIRPAFELSCFTNIVYMLSIASPIRCATSHTLPDPSRTSPSPSRVFFGFPDLSITFEGHVKMINPLAPKVTIASNFSLQYHPWITHQGCKNKGNDHSQ